MSLPNQIQQQIMAAMTDSFFIGDLLSKDGHYEMSSDDSSPSPSPTSHLNSFHSEAISSLIADSSDLLSDPNCLYRCEVDSSSGTVDYMSKKRNNRKAPERVLCFKPTDEASRFLISCAFYNGDDVSNVYLGSLLAKIKLDVTSSAKVCEKELLENSSSSSSSSSFGTPSSAEKNAARLSKGGEKTHDLYDATTPSNIVDVSMVKPLLQAFFSDACIQTSADEQFSISDNNLSRSNSSNSNDNLEKLIVNHVITPSLFTSMEIDGPMPILISIEGNIGAGKSTLLRALRNHPDLDWCFIDEPVDTWTSLKNDEGTSLLELFYGDQRRWSYTFQNCAVLSRFQNIEKTVANQRIKEPNRLYKVFVTERCLQTDYQVFAKMMRADGKMDKLEFDLYKKWYNLIEATATPLSAIVYVDTEPTTCFDRIKMRNRDGEEGIPLPYLTSLHTFQNAMIDGAGVPQCRVNSNDVEGAIKFVDGLIAKMVGSK